MKTILVILGFICVLGLVISRSQRKEDDPLKNHKFAVVKTEAEWRKILTPEQYKVTRQRSTELACSGAYWKNHEKGFINVFVANSLYSILRQNLNQGQAGLLFTKPFIRMLSSKFLMIVLGCHAPKFCVVVAAHTSDTYSTMDQDPQV
jgi:hypothetical protein